MTEEECRERGKLSASFREASKKLQNVADKITFAEAVDPEELKEALKLVCQGQVMAEASLANPKCEPDAQEKFTAEEYCKDLTLENS